MSRRNLQLDVLRGVAILFVFGRHLELPRPDGIVGAFANAWFRLGWLGVDLFFVLSGFLIGGLLVSELQRCGRIDIPRFLVRRGLKIYPAYIAFIAYLILVPVAKTLAKGGDWWGTTNEQWSLYWPNLLFLQNYVGTNPAGHTWSLAVEEHFYLLLPIALAALASAKRTRALIPICLLAVPILLLAVRFASIRLGDPYAEKMAATHLRLDALLFGVGIRCLAEYLPKQFHALRAWRISLVLVGVLLWSVNLFVEPQTLLIRTAGLAGTYLGSAAFLVAAFHTHAKDFGGLKRFADGGARFVAWIGVYSYAIYLWHVTAFGILGREIGGRIVTWNGGANSQTTWVATTLVVAAGAILAGVVATRMVEWPVLRLRDRFFPSRSGSLPAMSAPETAPITMTHAADSQSVSGRPPCTPPTA